MEEHSKFPERLYYRLYVTYIEATREQLQKVNKQSYFRISVWDNDKLLGEMLEGSLPAILSDKIFLTKAAVNFSHRFQGRDVVIRLTEYFSGESLLGIGMFSLDPVRQKYVEQSQRFHSLLQASLSTATTRYKLVFSMFVERDRYALDAYIKRFKENEKDVMRAKRNINNYKKEVLNRTIEREREAALTAKKTKHDARTPQNVEPTDKIDHLPRKDAKQTVQPNEGQKTLRVHGAAELQINSAAAVRPEVKGLRERKPLNEAEQKQFQAYSTIMQEYSANSHFISALDMQTPSVISDGSEQSQMRMRHERETYSEKAIKKFKGNVNIFVNVLMVVVAILMISFVITPSRKYTRVGRQPRKEKERDEAELFDI